MEQADEIVTFAVVVVTVVSLASASILFWWHWTEAERKRDKLR